jgi:Electron transfer DM13
MLKSKFIIFILGGLLGCVAGAGGMLIAFPFLFPPPVANDAAPVALTAAAATSIEFKLDENTPGRDPVHWANGSGQIIRTAQGAVLRLNGDFVAGPGPNFWIYLNTRAVGEEKDFNADAGRVKIAPLKSFKGAQNFVLPEGIDPAKFHTVTIWCESFGAYIGSGVLKKS